MKKLLNILLLCAAFGVVFTSCSKDDNDTNYFSAKQKEILGVLHGTFTSTLVNMTTTIDFIEKYSTPLTINARGEERENYVHGKYRLTHYNGDSYEYYYHVGYDGTTITACSTLDWIRPKVQDFSLIEENKFKLKDTGSNYWDTYTRK